MNERRARFAERLAFPLDGFQSSAMDALDNGESVLVAAPTGSGKTLVAEYAIEIALSRHERAFYTTPVKALSNQKFTDLRRVLGPDKVGLLTGDNAINPDADVVVMTTEVLRNMIYGRSPALDTLGVVVLDEVHYIQDTYRGPVWEEVIIHLPIEVQLVCLSATVSNAEELAEWMSTVRGVTQAVIEEKRPVRLDNLYMVNDRTAERIHLLPTLVGGRANHEALKIDQEGTRDGKQHKGARVGPRRALSTPSRLEVVERLDNEDMLPAIYFIFSRNQCDEAAQTCLNAGLRLTTGDERERIRHIVEDRLGGLDPRDLAVLGYGTFLACLESGFAAHHAGMMPPFKEVVEACFTEGLIKVVFATETLAVGINMPARSVVVEKLTKFTGDHHEFLKPGEYTQLTGRAGRRGIDTLGHAVVLWNPFVPFDQVAGLASSRSFHLTSAFRPTYNMACNLVRTYTSEEAHRLLNQSFAQYQADRDVVRMETRLLHRRQHLEALRAKAESPFGDLDEYRRQLSGGDGNRAERRASRFRDAESIEVSVMKLKPGDIIYVEKGKYAGKATVLATAHRKGHMRLTVMTTRRESMHLSAEDFQQPPRSLGTIQMPTPYAPNRHEFQRAVVHSMDKARLAPKDPSETEAPQRKRRGADRHPVELDPDLDHRLAAAAAVEKIEREVVDLSHRVKGTSQSLSRQFDRVLRILSARGYVDSWRLTARGKVLASTFHESDLLIAETMMEGLLDDLEPAHLAGLVSVFTYEHRSPEAPPAAWFPSLDVARRWRRIFALSDELARDEQEAGINPHRLPDPTFIAIAFAWAAGDGFAEIVEAEALSGGDFVRNIKQLIDLLRQLAMIAPNNATKRSAAKAAETLFRGVVSASSRIASVELPDESTDGSSAQPA